MQYKYFVIMCTIVKIFRNKWVAYNSQLFNIFPIVDSARSMRLESFEHGCLVSNKQLYNDFSFSVSLWKLQATIQMFKMSVATRLA